MARTIMIQGTMSNAGKSLIAAGLCRVFRQDGYKVAPFKSQNMALNSFVTYEGLEIGRAQAVQAEAAGIQPSVYMNPILLKPTGNASSQVIVNGRSIGDMTAKEYFEYKTSLIPDIKVAFQKLAEENDIIVIEGAGSPAEINLRHQDIVNMGLAEMVNAPVLLVGDIDRGGVFAQLLGTYLLFSEEEKRRVKGLIINKFRGDKNLLTPGIEMMQDKLPVPFLGVLPYEKLKIEDEDSLSDRLQRSGIKNAQAVDIVGIRLPWLSNFTDLDVFEEFDDVSIRYVDDTKDLGDPDLLVIPGSKNTIADLRWLKSSGLGEEIVRLAKTGTPIIGICGGYQILGVAVEDPFDVEAGGSETGLGLLPIKTVMAEKKKTEQFEGNIVSGGGCFDSLSGNKIVGYEIHMGRSEILEDAVRCMKNCVEAFTSDGTGLLSGNVYGTYVHGIFDEKGIAKTIVEALAKRKGLDQDSDFFRRNEDRGLVSRRKSRDREYDKLAELIRGNLDMNSIYELLQEAKVD